MAKETKVIVSANQKGGAGKTTAVMCLADGLARKGYDIIVIDADPQATAFKWESRPSKHFPRFPVRVEKLSGLSSIDFIGAVAELNELHKKETGDLYDYILIDTPPNLKSGDLEAALMVSDIVMVPAKPNAMFVDALEELYFLFATINNLRRQHGRHALDVRLLINFMYTNRASNINLVTALQRNCAKWAESRHIKSTVMTSQFKHLAAFENAPNYKTSIFQLPGSKDARNSVEQLVEELSA
jgi:cellulose biosynthesis protein BcsQ